MPATLFDSHAHLDASEFDADRIEVIAAARCADVQDMLVPAVDASSWPALHALCESQAGLHAAYGLHPMYLDRHSENDLRTLESWLRAHSACAIGECGLDFHAAAPDRERQLHFLRCQLQLAREFDLPLVLHARGAFEQVILELHRFGGALRGVVHSFSGSFEQAKRLWNMGFMTGIGGPVTHERARRLRKLVAGMPLEFLLLETDSPDQPDAAHRGQRNEPARLPEVLRCISQLRDQSESGIAQATTANARRLFAPST